jgi:hypothetical protein
MTNHYHDVHATNDGVFNANSGLLIDLNKPTVDMICIQDIAASLSKICRFGGHSSAFYSVAQHSCVVAALAPEYLCREALLHDATEAYLGDVIKPLKNILGPVYEDLEYEFMKVIIRKFKLDAENLLEVKAYDKQALTIEHQCYILCDVFPWFETMNRVNLNPATWSPGEARGKFMAFYRLFFEL